MLSSLQALEDKVINLVAALEESRAQVNRLKEENVTLKSSQQQEQDKLSGIMSLIEGV